MPLKIIKKTEEINKEENNDNITNKINIEETIQKMFFVCNTIIDSINNILTNVDFNRISYLLNEEEYQEEYRKIKRLIDTFQSVFCEKKSIVDVLSKITKIVQSLQKIANEFNISLIKQDVNDTNIQLLTDNDIEIISQIVKDFGIDELKQTTKKIQQEISIKNNNSVKNNKKEVMNYYEVYNEKTNNQSSNDE